MAQLPEFAGDALVGVDAAGETGLADLDGALHHVKGRALHTVGEIPGGNLVVCGGPQSVAGDECVP